MQIVVDNWQQMHLLPESVKEDVRVKFIDVLASKLAGEDPITIQQMIRAHRLNDREIELLMEQCFVKH